MTQFADRLLVGDAAGSARNDDSAETARPFCLRRCPDDADIDVRALQIPAACIARPMLSPIENVFAVFPVMDGGQRDSGRVGCRTVEIGRSARRARRLAHGPSGQIFAARIAGRRNQPLLLLPFRCEPDQRHQGQSVDEQDVAKPGSTAHNSSTTICRSTLEIPPPPYFLGMKPVANPSL
jgi:hypothetical protein